MAESSDCQDVQNDKAEENLDNLLDSALDDFTKEPKEKPIEKNADIKENNILDDNIDEMWTEMIKQALEADPSMREIFQQGSEEETNIFKDFAKISEAAAKAMDSDSGDSTNNFADIMSDTLKNFSENFESIQNQFGNAQELSALFQGMGLNGGAGLQEDGSIDNLPPMMQNIMQSFLSKEILYAPIKEFVDKYPGWLEEHKDSLPAEQYDKYSQQLELMKKVLEEFEAEDESDSEEVKKLRFQRIITLLYQMQALGHPPAELINADGSDDLPTPPNLPPGMDPNQCLLM